MRDPAVIPAAPWRSLVDALLWAHPATPAARAALPRQLANRGGAGITIGGLIRYRDGPVGPYDEVFGAPLVLRTVPPLSHVAFMAVDSQRSVIGGRQNWALPKELATFDGRPGQPGAVVAAGGGWQVRATATARGRRLPFFAGFRCEQVWPDGATRAFAVWMRGRARLGHVEISHGTPSPLAEWLSEGRHQAILVRGRQHVSAPRARPALADAHSRAREKQEPGHRLS